MQGCIYKKKSLYCDLQRLLFSKVFSGSIFFCLKIVLTAAISADESEVNECEWELCKQWRFVTSMLIGLHSQVKQCNTIIHNDYRGHGITSQNACLLCIWTGFRTSFYLNEVT